MNKPSERFPKHPADNGGLSKFSLGGKTLGTISIDGYIKP